MTSHFDVRPLEVLQAIATTTDDRCMYGLYGGATSETRCPARAVWQVDPQEMAPLAPLIDAAILNLRVCDTHRPPRLTCPYTGTPMWQRIVSP
jgi:hypothetical protein